MADNYLISRDRAQEYFLSFDQETIAANRGLVSNESFLYVSLFGKAYRICRQTGRVSDADGAQADYCQSMTIFDLLCHSDGKITATGNYAAVNSLKGAPKSGGVAPSRYTHLAEKIQADTARFSAVCAKMGAEEMPLGDLCYRFPVFDKLQVLLKFYYSDEEFPPTVTLLWDENILDYMHYETVFYAAQCLVQQLEEALERSCTSN